MAERDLGKEIEGLKEDMAKLRDDLAGIVDALKDVGKGRVEDAREGLGELADALRDALRGGLEGAREKSKKSVETVEQQIEQRPLLSLLAAFGVGVVLGKILDRS
jgi:ElaB/YqjD/DUF883 family membrane-anchored ribosome-binding protein